MLAWKPTDSSAPSTTFWPVKSVMLKQASASASARFTRTPTTAYPGYVRSRRGPLIDDPLAERLVRGGGDTNRGQLSRDSKQRRRLAHYQLVTAPSVSPLTLITAPGRRLWWRDGSARGGGAVI